MNNYVIMTDSSCDLEQSMLDELGVKIATLTLQMDGVEYDNQLDNTEMTPQTFYAALREGKKAVTSAVNVDAFLKLFEPALKEGNDILYLGFSSGLSCTYENSLQAIEMLKESYPQRKIIALDTLCASMGQGLLVYLAVKQKEKGKSLEEVRDFVLEHIPHLCHWFTVDDLHYLKRGGLISAGTEIIGSILNIKPVMHMDDEGKLVKVGIAKGRKTSIRRMKDNLVASAIRPTEQTVFISHGDCLEDAQFLADMLREEPGVAEVLIGYVGPVIGAHSGPGTLALFFVGEKR